MDPAFSPNSNPADPTFEESALENATRIPVIEEQILLSKRVVETGRVRIAKQVSEHQEHISVPVSHDEVDVERVAINRYVDTPPQAVRYEGDTMIISVLEEVVVVEKRLMLVEELHVTKRQVQTEAMQQVTLRTETVTVTREPAADEPSQQTNTV